MKTKLYLLFFIAFYSLISTAEETKPFKQFIVHLETGEKWDTSISPNDQKGFKEHSANMNRLRTEGVIQFGARYSEFGLLIVSVETRDKAIEILDADPGVKSGIFKFRVDPISIFYPWKEEKGQ